MDRPEAARTPSGSSSCGSICNDDKLKIWSPLGGDPLVYEWKHDESNAETVGTVLDLLSDCLKVYSNWSLTLRKSGKTLSLPNKEDFDSIKEVVDLFNKFSITNAKLWKGATNPETAEWSQDRCDTSLLTKIMTTVYNIVVKDAKSLNNHYLPFSSEVYGETKFAQMQKLIDQLNLKESDVFVDLGSGVGQLVLYVAGGTKVRRAVGIEIHDKPSSYALRMQDEYKKWMGWFKKKHRAIEIHQGSFLDPKYYELITQEATVVFINNFAFQPELEQRIRLELIANMKEGTRIISTKRYASGGKINHRHLGDVESILDVSQLDAIPCPTSWTDGPVPFFLHVVNRAKLENFFAKEKSKSSSNGTSRASNSTPSSGASSTRSREGSVKKEEVSPPKLNKALAVNAQSTTIANPNEDQPSTFKPSTSKSKDKKRRTPPVAEPPTGWNEPDQDYVPPGTKKPRKSSAGQKREPKVAGTTKRGRPPVRAPSRLSDEAQKGINELHSRIISPNLPTTNDNAGLIRVDLSGGAEREDSPDLPSSMDQRPDPMVLPEGAVILYPGNPLDNMLIEFRNRCHYFLSDTIHQDTFKQEIINEIEQQRVKKADLEEKIREKEIYLKEEIEKGVVVFKERLAELDMKEVQFPGELLNRSKQIVAQHKELTQSVSTREAEVACLEGKTRNMVPYGEILIDKLAMLDDCSDDKLDKDKYVSYIQLCAVEGGYPAPRFEVDEQHVEGIISPGGPRRRNRPRNGGGRKGKPEENNEEMDRKVAAIVQAAMKVEHEIKERDRKARGAAALEKAPKKSSGASEPVAVPLPRTTTYMPSFNRSEEGC